LPKTKKEAKNEMIENKNSLKRNASEIIDKENVIYKVSNGMMCSEMKKKKRLAKKLQIIKKQKRRFKRM